MAALSADLLAGEPPAPWLVCRTLAEQQRLTLGLYVVTKMALRGNQEGLAAYLEGLGLAMEEYRWHPSAE